MSEKENVYYVYLHRRNDTNEVFYVGKGKDKRAWSRSGRNEWWLRIVAKTGFTVEFIEQGISEQSAFDLEVELIKFYRDCNHTLCNLTDGGEGQSGYKRPQEITDRIAAALKDRPKTVDHRKSLSLCRTPDKKILCSTGIVYDSVVDAMDWLRTMHPVAATSRILKCCRRESRSAYTFVWRYVDDATDVQELLEQGKDPFKVLNRMTKKTPVGCSNGMQFESILSASEWVKATTGVQHPLGQIAAACSGKVRSAHGLRWWKIEESLLAA